MKRLTPLFLISTLAALAQTSPFTSIQTIPFDSARSISTADVNKDNIPDLIVTNYNSETVAILLGSAGGSFSPTSGSPFPMGPKPIRAVAGDFNKDARLDIAVLHEAALFPVSGGFQSAPAVSIYFGTTSGFSLAPGSPIRLQGDTSAELILRDVNLDGNLDIVAVTTTPNVILGNGSGGFITPIVGPASAFPGANSAAIADFNADGRADLAYALIGGPDETGILLGDGQGHFPTSFGVLLSTLNRDLFSSPWRVTAFATADINNDGIPDLLAASGGRGQVFAWTGSGSGMQAYPASATPVGTPAGDSPSAIVAADFNGDGKVDFITANPTASNIAVGIGTNSGFAPAAGSPFPMGAHVSTLASGDFNRDGRNDVAIVHETGVTILLNNGSLASTRAQQTIYFPPIGDKPLATGSFVVTATASSNLTVTLTSNSTNVCTASGLVVTLVSRGQCVLTASQSGNDVYQAAPSVQQTFNVTLTTQTINFPALPDVALGAAPFTISATASSGLPVTFSTSSTTCSVSGNTVTILNAGFCAITASQAGNGSYEPAQLVRGFNIGGTPAQSQTILFSSLNPQSLGVAPFPIYAAASSGLPITFTSATPTTCYVTPLGQSPAYVSVLAAGTCSITASQPGNASYLAATPVTQTFDSDTPSGAPQFINFNAPASLQLNASPGTFTVNATSGLLVTVTSYTQNTCIVNGGYIYPVSSGFCVLAATQPGDTVYAPAPGLLRVLNVSSTATQTITFDPLPDRALAAGAFTVSATSSSSLPVTFSTVTTNVCTVSGNTVTPIAAGVCTVTASQSGDSTWGPAIPVDRSFTVSVNQRAQTINTATPLSYALSAGTVQLTATATSGLPVTLTSVTPSTCSLTANLLHLLAVGQCTVVATQTGNALFLPANSVVISVTITPAPLVPVITSIVNAASYVPGRIAPDTYVAIFGQNFGSGPRVTIRDNANNATIVIPSYASDTQINFVWPSKFPVGPATINVGSSVGSTIASVTVSAVGPALFSADSTGSGLAAAQVLTIRPGQDPVTTLVTGGPISIPSGVDVYLILYGTGIRNHVNAVIARTGDFTAQVLYAGAQGTFPGLDQVNLKLPASLAGKGSVDIQLIVDGVITNTVTATFQ